MKKLIFLFSFALLTSFAADAQRICYVDVNKIMDSVPEYGKAQDELDRIAEKWKQDISKEYSRIETMYSKYQAEEVLLSEEQRKSRQDEILEKEKQVRNLQKEKFGAQGELFKKRQSMVKPIQDKVYSAIESYAKDKGFDLVLDKASNTGILFSSATYDKTDDIIKRLGN